MKLAVVALVTVLAGVVNGDGKCTCYERARVDLYDDKKAEGQWPKALKRLNREYKDQQDHFECSTTEDVSETASSGDDSRARRSGGHDTAKSLLDKKESCNQEGELETGDRPWMNKKGAGKCPEHHLERLLGCSESEIEDGSCGQDRPKIAAVIQACTDDNKQATNVGDSFTVSNPKQCASACSICGCGGFEFHDNDECFPADATVELADGTAKPMAELAVGDKVRVGPAEFSEVFMFSHQNADVQASFVKLTVGGAAATIRLTAGHYLYVNGGLQTARTVKVGDTVTTPTGTANVTEVSREWAPGLYNPHTLHGDIVVDGVLTSTYTESVAPAVAHALLFPARAAYRTGLTVGGKNWEKGGGAWATVAAKLGLRGDDHYPL